MKHFVILLLIIVATVGCQQQSRGLKTEFVSGVVTYKGAPLAGASVQFIPANSDAASGNLGEAAAGNTDAEGKFMLTSMNGDVDKGAIAGEYKVLISKVNVTQLESEEYGKAPKNAKLDSQGRPITVIQEDAIPANYKNRNNTPLKAIVNPGKNTFQFDLVETM